MKSIRKNSVIVYVNCEAIKPYVHSIQIHNDNGVHLDTHSDLEMVHSSDLRLHNSLALASPLSGKSKLDYKNSIDNNNSYHNAVHVHIMYVYLGQ